MTGRLGPALIKTGAFARKEIADVVRQPRLILMLVLGPFLILALFGIGYQHDLDPMRAVLVVDEEDAALRAELESRLDEVSGSFEIEETTTDRAEAALLVRRNQVDVAVLAPTDPYSTVRAGERATFTLLHDILDPVERATMDLIAKTAIDAVNRALLAEIVAGGQEESEDIAPLLTASRESASLLRAALETGDTEGAREQRRLLADQLGGMATRLRPTDALSAMLGEDDTAPPLGARLAQLQEHVLQAGEEALDQQTAELAEVEGELERLETMVAELRTVPPEILVSPLAAETQLIGSTSVGLTDFYAPGVIALLLQHLAITFASLSLVREASLGTPEVFQVAPLGAGHILAGKYIGYTVWAGVVAAALSGLVFAVFGLPLAGSSADYTIVLALLVAASLGVGFVISSFVTSDTQAVNVTMIVLLLSIFFSGFFMSLDRLIPAVRIVSWLLPITHGIDALRDVMFRGASIDLRTWLALGLGAVVSYALALALLRMRLREH